MTSVIVSVVAILLIVAGALGYLIGGGAVPWIAMSAFSPYLLAVSVPACAGFAWSRQWALLPVAVVGLVLFLVTQVPRYVATADPAGASGASLVVMTANLGLGGADPATVVDEVRSRKVDALMVQELTFTAERDLRAAGLDRVLGHHLATPGREASGTGLWSRYPLTETPWPRLSFYRVAARVAVPGMAVRPTLVALHVGGPVPNPAFWQNDLERLPDMLAELPYDAPVVVGGDFNATRSVPQFRDLLTGGYADAADQAGAGGIRTYPSDTWFPPLLGIDHILTRDAVGRSADTVTIPGTDHRALVVRVALH